MLKWFIIVSWLLTAFAFLFYLDTYGSVTPSMLVFGVVALGVNFAYDVGKRLVTISKSSDTWVKIARNGSLAVFCFVLVWGCVFLAATRIAEESVATVLALLGCGAVSWFVGLAEKNVQSASSAT